MSVIKSRRKANSLNPLLFIVYLSCCSAPTDTSVLGEDFPRPSSSSSPPIPVALCSHSVPQLSTYTVNMKHPDHDKPQHISLSLCVSLNIS